MTRASFSAMGWLILVLAFSAACTHSQDGGQGTAGGSPGTPGGGPGTPGEVGCTDPDAIDSDEETPTADVPEPEAGPPGISVATTNLVTIAGESETLRLGFFDEQGNPLIVPRSGVAVRTSNPQIANATVTGREDYENDTAYLTVTAGSPGAATITVSHGVETRDIRVTVRDNVPATLSLNTTRLTLKEGHRETVKAFFYHREGMLLDSPLVTVTSSALQVVDAQWRGDELGGSIEVTAIRPGTATLTVSSGNVRGQIIVAVTEQRLAAISLQYDRLTISPDCSFFLPVSFLSSGGDSLWVSKNEVTATSTAPSRVSVGLSADGGGYVSGLEVTAGVAGSATVLVSARGVQARLAINVISDGSGYCPFQGEEEEEEEEEEEDVGEAQGELGATADPFFYFTYDDSASTAAVELAKYKLRADQIPSAGLARPWEFLNHERFAASCPHRLGLFDVSMGLLRRASVGDMYRDDLLLGAYVAAPFISKEQRNNLVLTVLIDNSGSMSQEIPSVEGTSINRMEMVHYGLRGLLGALKPGDLVNVVSFNTVAQIELEGSLYETGRPNLIDVRRTIDSVVPTGSTNLAAGISLAYQVARRHYDPSRMNRIVMLTDAYANVGEVDPALIADNIVIGGNEGIYFSGLGVGEDFNEEFLNVLTEKGKGAYFSLVTRSDAARAFNQRFMALLTVAAKDVRFKLTFPSALSRAASASEESSVDPEAVQPTNFSFNTRQYFYEAFKAGSAVSINSEKFTLTISYKDPATLEPRTEEIETTVADLLGRHERNIRAAETIFLLNQLMGQRMHAPEVNAVLDTYPSGFSTPLFDEYKELIQRYELLAAPAP